MRIADADKRHIALLLVIGNKSGAVRHIQQTFSLPANEALTLAEKLESRHVVKDIGEPVSVRWRVTGIVFTIAGFILLSLCFVFGIRDYSSTMHSLPVTGRVISLEVSYENGSSKLYAPVVEYMVGGKSFHVKTAATSSPTHLAGEEIALLVDPRTPQEPRFNSFVERWFNILLLAGVGVFFSAVGFVVRKMMSGR